MTTKADVGLRRAQADALERARADLQQIADWSNNTTDRQVRMWAVELVQRLNQELAIGSISMGLQVAEVFAQYAMTGEIHEDDGFDGEVIDDG